MLRNLLYKFFIHNTNRTIINFLGDIQSYYREPIIPSTVHRITFIKEIHKDTLKFSNILNYIFFLVTFINTKIFIKIPSHIIRSKESLQLLPIKDRNISKRAFNSIPRKMIDRMNEILEAIFNILSNSSVLQIFYSILFMI